MSAIMSSGEAVEYRVRLSEGCWYCNRQSCILTHKSDPLKAAQHPERDPYADERPYWKHTDPKPT